MTEDEAAGLAEFIKDHDKRFEAKARTGEGEGVVLLTRASDGAEMEPLRSPEQYQAAHIEQDDPGPTVRAAWQRWSEKTASG